MAIEDLAVNDQLDVYIDGGGDIATVSGRDAFEQELSIRLKAQYEDLISAHEPGTVVEGLKVGAQRVAASRDEIVNVSLIDASFKDDQPNTVEVTIVYDTGEKLTFDVN